MYVIVRCPKCHQHTMAKATQKTRTCPYCNTRIIIENHKVKTVTTGKIAIEEVKKYNARMKEFGLGKWMSDKK